MLDVFRVSQMQLVVLSAICLSTSPFGVCSFSHFVVRPPAKRPSLRPGR